jgi:hypothetical protein
VQVATTGSLWGKIQENSKTDKTTSELMETLTATPSSDEGPRMSRRNKKTPINQK